MKWENSANLKRCSDIVFGRKVLPTWILYLRDSFKILKASVPVIVPVIVLLGSTSVFGEDQLRDRKVQQCSDLVVEGVRLEADFDPKLNPSTTEQVTDLLVNQRSFLVARNKAAAIEKVFAALHFGEQIHLDYAHDYSPAWVYGPGEGPGLYGAHSKVQPRRLDYWLVETFPFLFSLQHKEDPEFGLISEITVLKPNGLILPTGQFSMGLVPIDEKILEAESPSGFASLIQRKNRKSYPKDVYRSR